MRIGVFRESMGLSESFHQASTCADLTCSWRVPAKATGRHTWVIIIMFVRSCEVILHFFKGYEVHLWGRGCRFIQSFHLHFKIVWLKHVGSTQLLELNFSLMGLSNIDVLGSFHSLPEFVHTLPQPWGVETLHSMRSSITLCKFPQREKNHELIYRL